MPDLQFHFVAIAKTEFIHKDGEEKSKAVHADVRLEVSKNLSKKHYHNSDGTPTQHAIKPTTIALVSGLVANVKYAAQQGWWNEQEHIDYIIEQIKRVRNSQQDPHISTMEY